MKPFALTLTLRYLETNLEILTSSSLQIAYYHLSPYPVLEAIFPHSSSEKLCKAETQ